MANVPPEPPRQVPFTAAEWTAAYNRAVRLSGAMYINPALSGTDFGRDNPDGWRATQVLSQALRTIDRDFPGEWDRRIAELHPPGGEPAGGSKIRSTLKSRRRKLKKGKKHRTRRAH